LNYRHAFHAGNFADCMKHALLLSLVRAMGRKEAGFCVLDTHAGSGRYDLAGSQAERTGEWRDGIGRLMASPRSAETPGIVDYLETVERLGLYPGSPSLTRALLRPQDRLICCELNPEEQASLRRLFRDDAQVAVHLRDGYEGLRAFLPPKERRGLVLIDPPFEEGGEFDRLFAALREGVGRFPGGVFAAWYPVKYRARVRTFYLSLVESGLRDIVAAELMLRPPNEFEHLGGCGLVVINPPYRFEEEAVPILAALVDILGEPGVTESALTRLVAE
jgi:23S rRNA (adenine2030-N6)-methyltransferase